MLKRWDAWPTSIRWLTGIAAGVLTLALLWALFVPLADWLARTDVGSVGGSLHETAVDNARGRLLTLGAGLVAVGALVFTALNFRLLRRNSEQADQWQRRTHELTEQGQVTDRYTKAVEQLGSETLDVRIGGIYALERVARDSPRDHPAVMDVLTAFIREHSWEQWPVPRIAEEEDEDLVEFTRPDIQAAFTVVGRRDSEHDIRSIDLTRADLTRADLTYADLTDAYLTGAYLAGADFLGTYLTGADLTGANLAGAHLDGAYFTAADLTSANLAVARGEAYLDWADLSNADLTGASLAFADLSNADLTGATLTDTDLSRADLTGVTWPADTPVPDGWELDPGTGELQQAGPEPAAKG